MQKIIGILGGTFDPIHQGHLIIAEQFQHYFPTADIHFIPSKVTLLKDPAKATQQQRLEMLQTALKDYSNVLIDQRELLRDTPSYTIETLQSLHKEFSDATLCLILGIDQFSQFTAWHEWEKIFELAHIAIAPRSGYTTSFIPPLDQIFQQRCTKNPYDFTLSSHGRIWIIPMSPVDISSTHIRATLRNSETKTQADIPIKIWEYIIKNRLY